MAILIANTLAVSNNGTIKILIAIRGAFSNKKGRPTYASGVSAKNFKVRMLITKPTTKEPVSPIKIFLSDEILNPKKARRQAFNEILNRAKKYSPVV